jgi:hypothetical protein
MFAEKFRALARTRALAACLAAGLAATAATPSLAASGTASFIVVHGIPGRDVGASLDPALPVDVLVAGSLCLLKSFTFGDIAGPFDVPSGTYSVAISLANPISPCSGSPVISASVTLNPGDYDAIVAQLNSQAAPAAGVYPIDVTPVGAGNQRVVTIHAADAPEVSVKAVSLGPKREAVEFKIKPGQTIENTVPTRQGFFFTLHSLGTLVAGPIESLNAGDQSLIFTAAVGNASSGSVTILTKLIRSVF